MSTKRIEWIDIVKGFAILLVILGHTEIYHPVFTYIYSYHMALFFIMSGWVFSVKKYKNYGEFVISKFKTLIIPYIVFKIFNDLVYYIYAQLGFVIDNTNYIDRIIGIILQIRETKFESGLWFLTCLFLIENMYYFMIKYLSEIKKLICVFIVGIVGCIYIEMVGYNLPLYIDIALICLPFFYIGNVLKNINIDISSNKNIIIFIVLHFVAMILNYKLTGKSINIYFNTFGYYPLFYIEGIFGSLAVISIIKRTRLKNKWLQYIGKNSLIYYALHQTTIMPICSFVMKHIIKNVDGLFVWQNCIYYFVETVLICIVITPIAFIINMYFPFVLGKGLRKIKNDTDSK
mgnify:CR=1 FL=1